MTFPLDDSRTCRVSRSDEWFGTCIPLAPKIEARIQDGHRWKQIPAKENQTLKTLALLG